jgi:ABC-type Na+ efflux pump permease subunit
MARRKGRDEIALLLYVSGLIPRFLAVLGLVGYISLWIGIPVSLIGDVQLDAGWGLIFVALGAVFELVVPLVLIFKGFSFPEGEPREEGGTWLAPERPVGVSV